MIKRTIEVSSEGTYVSLSDKQLELRQNGSTVGRVPIEDIGVFIVDSRGVTLTSGAMAAILEAGAVILVCDGKHHPAGLLLPLAANTLHAERLADQTAITEPLKKRLWARIVARKIRNQAALIPPQQPARARLLMLARTVKSGDPENFEAQASRAYWPALLGEDFRREQDDDPRNGFLNYGYAVLRAAMARALVGTGLHATLGIHHHNRYNAFALADDLMEPFRPFVDARVEAMIRDGFTEMSRDAKQRLLPVLTDTAWLGGEKGPLLVAAQKCAASLAAAFAAAAGRNGGEKPAAPDVARLLLLPELRLETEQPELFDEELDTLEERNADGLDDNGLIPSS